MKYTKGGLKKLREALRAWKKKEGYLQNDRTKLEQEIAAFQRLPIPSPDDRDAYAEYQDRKRALDKRSDTLTKKAQELAEQKAKLDAWQKRLAAQIDAPQGKEKIKEIALDIMRKNAPYQKRYDALKAGLDRAAERMNRAKIQMDALAKVVKTDRSNVRRYKVAAPEKYKTDPVLSPRLSPGTNIMRALSPPCGTIIPHSKHGRLCPMQRKRKRQIRGYIVIYRGAFVDSKHHFPIRYD